MEIPAYRAWGGGQEFPVSEPVTKEVWLKMKNKPKPTSDPSTSQLFSQIFPLIPSFDSVNMGSTV